MKVLVHIVFFLLTVVGSSYSQSFCGTPQGKEFMKPLIANKANWDATIKRGSMLRFVPVNFIRVGQNNGDGRTSKELCYKTICIINENYKELGVDIHLYVKGFSELNSTSLYTNAWDNGGLMSSAKDRAAMNIFCVGDIVNRRDPNLPSTTAGFYSPGSVTFGDYIVIRNDQLGIDNLTIEHEVGHYFTLAHTHRGWEDEPWNPDDYDEKIEATTISSIQTSPVPIELVDRSNCETSGDFICDTQADYGRGQSCNCCTLNETILDRNCDTLMPMMNNIMSYSGNCADWQFSDDQILAMKASFDSAERDHIRVGQVTDYEPITAEAEPLYPINLEKVDVYDNVTLQWSDVTGAQFYRVQINGSIYETFENSITITDLPKNDLVFWSVRSYGIFGGGCVDIQEQGFETGEMETSAISDLEYVNGFNVFPNPLTEGEEFNVSLESDKSFTAVIKVYDLTGRTLHNQSQVSFVSGQNTFSIPSKSLSKGIHILELTTAEGSITEKIIVE